jgi:DNA replication and repair protein RecF
MYLKAVFIKGWRNYKEERVVFPRGINLFLGKNGQGKTNLLEAIYFLSCGQSPRTIRSEELINWDSQYFYLKGELSRNGTTSFLEIGGARDGRRAYKADGVPLSRQGDISGVLNAVFFMPEDLYLVKGGPLARRNFLDLEIGKVNKAYRYALGCYKKFLRQRNALLKSRSRDEVLLGVLTEKIAELAGPVVQHRQGYLQKLSVLARLKHRRLSGNEELVLKYQASLAPGLGRREVLARFAQVREQEQKLKVTVLGPHKDDFSFILDGADLRNFGSQGQQRTAVLAVKLAEIELIKAETGQYPLLLLDDVMSELDEERKSFLLEYLTNGIQTFISSTEPLPAQQAAKEYWIESGCISERN